MKARWAMLASGPLAMLAQHLVPSAVVEQAFARGLSPALARAIGTVTGWFPLSVAELGVLALCLSARWWWRRGWAIACTLSLGYAAFVALWGLNYRREPIGAALGLEPRDSTVDELRALVDDFVARMNLAREAVPEREGVATLSGDFADAAARAQDTYRRAGVERPWLAGDYAPVKPLLLSPAASAGGLAGVYIPFTAEPHLSTSALPFTLPFNACHEMAHQRGVAREDEANFVAFLVARDHGDPDFRYSAYAGVLSHLLGALAQVDPDSARAARDALSPRVRADREAYKAWWDAHRVDWLWSASAAANHAYLRSNGVPDGVASYGRVVDLLLAEHRARAAP
ncbi:MAG: DUF3810 domain-containing protein [Deltaproteobacteria bacterium]|nr:DUF3810 domain-containing protein [Deltaproteobacteria bacterium]